MNNDYEYVPGPIDYVRPGDSVRILQHHDEETGDRRFDAAKVVDTRFGIQSVLIEYCGGDKDGQQEWWPVESLEKSKCGDIVNLGGDGYGDE
jgi:hypothetical protein